LIFMSRDTFQLVWDFLEPSYSLPLLLLLGVPLLWTRWARIGRAVTTLGAAGLFLLSAFLVENRLGLLLEGRFPIPQLPRKVDGIIVLGGSVNADLTRLRQQTVLNQNGDRLVQFVALARQHPKARLVFTGGGTGGGFLDEAELSAQVLAELGLGPERVEFEIRSTSTRENAILTKDMVSPRPGEVWVLVTSAWHLPRAVGVFRVAGWEVVPYPVGFTTSPLDPGLVVWPSAPFAMLPGLRLYLRELVSLAVYHTRGWTDAFLPGPTAASATNVTMRE
jgi:uncharacterized SAM-binding protein YcdF (DUF218 family)